MSVRARPLPPVLHHVAASALALALAGASVAAQPSPPVVRDSARTVETRWLRRRDAVTLGSFVLAALAAYPFDARLAEAVRDPGPQGSALLRHGAHVFNLAGDPGSLVAAATLFGAGRIAHSPRLASLGLHATEAIVVAGAVTTGGKLLVGRQRPNVETGDADDFVPGRGYREGRSSLPSGHTTVAFAFASAVTSELRARHAASAPYVGPLLYGGAALVGGARMYDNKHWASDVVLGAGIGTVAGHLTVAYARAHPHGWLEGLVGRTGTGQ